MRQVSLLITTVLVVIGCASDPQTEQSQSTALPDYPEYASADTLFPHIRYTDGLVSVNDRCMVRGVKLNRRMPPVYVNGSPLGFC